jgi:DNA-binding transcriptional ArsR family regulator
MTRERVAKNSILTYFNERPNQKFYLRELSRKLKLDAGNLSRALNSLVEKNLLLKAKEGNLTFFSINPTKLDSDKTSGLLESKELKNYLSKIEPDLIKFCQSLIRVPSVSGENPEEKIAQFIFSRSKELGLVPKIISKEHRRPNVVIDLYHKTDSTKPNFFLVGHMDTIGVGEIDNWRYYPFSAHPSGGRIYGRGAIDMKAGIACQIFTLKMIKDLNINLPANPRVVLVSNEEGGSASTPIFDLGMEYLIEEGLIDGIAAIYCYGGSYNVG